MAAMLYRKNALALLQIHPGNILPNQVRRRRQGAEGNGMRRQVERTGAFLFQKCRAHSSHRHIRGADRVQAEIGKYSFPVRVINPRQYRIDMENLPRQLADHDIHIIIRAYSGYRITIFNPGLPQDILVNRDPAGLEPFKILIQPFKGAFILIHD